MALNKRTKLILVLVIINFIGVHSDSESNSEVSLDDSKTEAILKSAEVIEDTDVQNYERLDNVERNADDVTDKLDANLTEFEDRETLDKLDEVTTIIDATDATTEDYTASFTDNNVYKHRDSTDDIYSNNNDEKVETTTPLPEYKMKVDAEEFGSNHDDADKVFLRNPKTDNSEQEIPDGRSFDTKPQPPVPVVSRSSTLRGWLEDSWLRPPAGLLVPLRPVALNRALAVWNDLTAEGLDVSDIVIVGYDSNGVNWRSRHNLQPRGHAAPGRGVSEALSKLLLKYQGVHIDASSDATMRALATAAKLVPYDSALFLITDKGAGDPQRLPLALRALVEKRLKVYTIWTNPDHPSAESELALQELRNISRHTEGDVLPYSLQAMDVDNDSPSNLATEVELQHWVPPQQLQQQRRGRVNEEANLNRFDTILVWRGSGEAISLGLPVDTGVTALRIVIEGAVDHAVLYPPNDAPQVDLYNATSVASFSPSSRTNGISPRDVYLNFAGSTGDNDGLAVMPATPSEPHAMLGLWHLSVRCDTCDYRLVVTARSLIHLDVEPLVDAARIRVTGPVASVRESLLVDEYGAELAKLSFSYQPTADGHEVHIEPVTELVENVPLPPIEGSNVYVKIVGRDIDGQAFIRLSGPISQPEVRLGRSAATSLQPYEDLDAVEEENARAYAQIRYNDSNVLPFGRAVSQMVNQNGALLTAVQIGLSTRLYGSPGDSLQLHFEVTNYREQSVSFRFGAVGEFRFLTGINPAQQTIPSGQTVNVIVSLTISTTAQPGARDFITFTAYGLDQVSISAYVYVINSGASTADVWPPEIRHNFQGSCIGRLDTDCSQHVWSASIIARDALGGLLRLTSSPIGLVYDSNFISGTREEVVATYRATCCAPRVVVTAVDSYGNVNSYIVDISNYFTPAAISAIVLGVFLALALIILLGYLIYWCVRRRKESRELPYSTSSRNIS